MCCTLPAQHQTADRQSQRPAGEHIGAFSRLDISLSSCRAALLGPCSVAESSWAVTLPSTEPCHHSQRDQGELGRQLLLPCHRVALCQCGSPARGFSWLGAPTPHDGKPIELSRLSDLKNISCLGIEKSLPTTVF